MKRVEMKQATASLADYARDVKKEGTRYPDRPRPPDCSAHAHQERGP